MIPYDVSLMAYAVDKIAFSLIDMMQTHQEQNERQHQLLGHSL